MFTEETGIDVEVRYGDSAELGRRSPRRAATPADVFFARTGLARARSRTSCWSCRPRPRPRPDGRFRDGRALGRDLGRSRVLVYNTDALSEDEVPDSVFGLTTRSGKGGSGSHRRTRRSRRSSPRCASPRGTTPRGSGCSDLKASDPKIYEGTRRSSRRARGRGRPRPREPLLPLPRPRGAAGRADREPLPRRRRPRRARQRRGRGRAREHRPADDASASSSSSSRTGQRFYVDEAEEAEYPLVAGSSRRRDSLRSTSSRAGRRPDELRRRARGHDRALRDRLPDVRRGAGTRAPPSARPRGGHRRRALLLPLAYLVVRARAAARLLEILGEATTWRLVWNTVLLAVGVVASSVLVGVPLAWLVTRTDPGRRAWATRRALPLVIPSYVAAFCLLGFFGDRGLLADALGRRAPAGDQRVLGIAPRPDLATYPYVFLLTQSALRARPFSRGSSRGLGHVGARSSA